MRRWHGNGLLWISWIWALAAVQAYDAYDYEYFGNDTLYLDPYVELRVLGNHGPRTWSAPASDSSEHSVSKGGSGSHQTWTVTATSIESKSSSQSAGSDSSGSDPISISGSNALEKQIPSRGQQVESLSQGSQDTDGTCSTGSCSNPAGSQAVAGHHPSQTDAAQEVCSAGDPGQGPTCQSAASDIRADGSISQLADGSSSSSSSSGEHHQQGSHDSQQQQPTQHGSIAEGAPTGLHSSGHQPPSWDAIKQQHDAHLQDILDDGSYNPDRVHPLWMWDTCRLEGEAVILNGTRQCHLSMVGTDSFVGGILCGVACSPDWVGHFTADLLPGGLDGIYRLTGCYAGKAYYLREEVPGSREVRSLWWHPHLGSWIYAFEQEPRDDNIIAYGTVGKISPLDVDGWHLSAIYNGVESQYLKGDDEELYFKIPTGFVSVMCLDDLTSGAYAAASLDLSDQDDEYDDVQESDERSNESVHSIKSAGQHNPEQHAGAGAGGASHLSQHKINRATGSVQLDSKQAADSADASSGEDRNSRGTTGQEAAKRAR